MSLKRLLFITCMLGFHVAFTQNLSNKGREFWVGYGHNQLFSSGNLQEMTLYLSAEQPATVTVTVNGTSFVQTVNIPANTVNTSIILPKSGGNDARLVSEGLSTRGVHIESDVPIVAYVHCTGSASSGATMLLPVETYGNTYFSINSEQRYANNCYSWFFVVASENNTVVEITPSAATLSGRPANVPFTVTLNKGQIYNVMGAIQSGSTGFDLTGSKIKSVLNGAGQCLPIGVFSGSSRTAICTGSSGDYIIQQIFPANAWGTRYLTSPTVATSTVTQNNVNIYRVAVRDPSTIVKRNGIVLTGIIRNFYYEFQSSAGEFIEANKPILVSQYLPSSGGCGYIGEGDPEMFYISPVEQAIKRISFFNSNRENASIANNAFVNIIIPSAGLSSLKIDGFSTFDRVYLHPQNSNYRIVVKRVSAPAQHIVTCDSGFTAITYGLASVESYGYNAGTLVNNLNSINTIQNTFSASPTNPFTCKNTPFRFSIQLSYLPTKLVWQFSQSAGLVPNTDSTINNPSPVDSAIIGGRKYYTFTVAKDYQYSDTGTFTVPIKSSHPDIDNCDQTEILTATIRVNPGPKSDFTYNFTGCVSDTVRFTGVDTSPGFAITRWRWTFDDGSIDSTRFVKKLFTSPGNHPTKLQVIADNGCFGDTTKSVVVNPKPTVKFGAAPITLCQGGSVTFTDSSTFAGPGALSNYYWDFGNSQVLNATNANAVSSIYNNYGSYTIKHVVSVGNTCSSDTAFKIVTVTAKPDASFTVPTGCLADSTAQFNSNITVPDGQAITSYSWNFGDANATPGNPNTSTLANPTHKYSAYGTYNVTLIVATAGGCRDTTTIPFTIGGFATAINYTVANETALCSQKFVSATNQMDVVTDSVYRIDIYWDYLNQSTVFDRDNTPTLNETYTHTYPVFTTPASKTVTLRWVVYSRGGCISEKTKIITLYAAPVLTFNSLASASACVNSNAFSIAQANATNGVTGSGIYSGNGTTATGTFTPSLAGIGTHTIKYVYTTNAGCKDSVSQTITVFPKPVANFNFTNLCDSTLFIDSSRILSGTIASWNWNFGDATSVIKTDGNPFKKLYTASGTYVAKLVVISDSSCTSDTVSKSITINPLPQPNFTVSNETTLCSQNQVRLTNTTNPASDTMKRVDIYWDYTNQPTQFDVDNTPLPNEVYSHLYPSFTTPATKTVTVRWVLYTRNGCTSTFTKTITLHAIPTLSFTRPGGLCINASTLSVATAVVSNGLAGTGIYSGPGTDAAGNFNPSIAGEGVKTIKYVYNTTGGCTDSITTTISVFPQPVARWGSTVVCQNDSTRFTDTSTITTGTIKSWNWTYGDGNTSVRTNGQPYNYAYATYGNYNPGLTVTSDSGCVSATVSRPLVVNPLPSTDFSMPASACLPGGSVAFTNLTTVPAGFTTTYTYVWNFGDGSSNSTATSPTHVYSTGGNYSVTLTATSAEGCIADSVKIFNKFFPAPFANYTVSSTAICQGVESIFTDTSIAPGSSISQWSWNFGDGSTSTVRNPRKTYTAAGIYPVNLQVTTPEGCTSDTIIDVTVYVQPKIDAGPDRVVPDGTTIQLQPVVNDTTLSFLWTPSTYLNNPAILRPTLTPVFSQTYKLTAIGAGDCTASDTVRIIVLKSLNIPTAFSPNKDGTNDVWNVRYLADYPGAVLEIFNRYGQIVYRSVGYSTPWDGTMNGNILPVGVYYYIIDLKQPGNTKISGSVTLLR